MADTPETPPIVPEPTAGPPAGATPEEISAYLVSSGQMVEMDDGKGGKFMMPAAVATEGTPEFPEPANPPPEETPPATEPPPVQP